VVASTLKYNPVDVESTEDVSGCVVLQAFGDELVKEPAPDTVSSPYFSLHDILLVTSVVTLHPVLPPSARKSNKQFEPVYWPLVSRRSPLYAKAQSQRSLVMHPSDAKQGDATPMTLIEAGTTFSL
jgi:hypothetical protein